MKDEKLYEYAELDARLPEEKELWKQGIILLKGYGFSDEQIHSE